MACLRSLASRVGACCLALGCALGNAPAQEPLEAPPTAPQSSAAAHSDADLEFFERRIRPLLANRCYECHSGQAKEVRGGLRLDRRERLLAGGDSGPAVIPGKPDESLLVQAVRYRQDVSAMPPRGKLPQPEIDLLTEWVRRGAPFPAEPAESPAAEKRAIDIAAGRNFWSFRPLAIQSLPATRHAPAGRIDAFLLAELESRGLSPSPPADRRTLLRRLYFDLVGLPPTAEELDEFEQDAAPDAFGRRVERLLASPHFGERWGRHWLDLVRYCDVLEDWAVEKDARAWLYRDWVVAALNSDVPYDRFLQLQLAADQDAEAQPGDIAALGFLGLSPSYWKELKLDPSVIKTVVADEWEERIHTLGGTILGLTIACARCHDHKQDPITQEDYYALAGVFASTRQVARSLLPADEARALATARARLAQLEQQRAELLKKKEPMPEDQQLIEELAKELDALRQAAPHLGDPLAYAVEDASLHVLPDGPSRTRLEYRAGEAQDVAMQVRGNPANPGRVVPRRFLSVLSPDGAAPFRQGSGRLELARALVANGGPLAARVIVNRVWKQYFGTGLVQTASNFGAGGTPPTHPALLDDLAARFVAHGWSLKWLHREIVLSAAYQQSSADNAAAAAVDPDNRLLWRMHRRRLDVEAWRDAMLAASGLLHRQPGGPDQSLDDPQNSRRTLYATIKRREVHALLRLHDFPDPTTHSPGRDVTTTPLQQLFVLNSPFLAQQAQALADRICREAPAGLEAQLRHAHRLVFGRAPGDEELRLAAEYFSQCGAAKLDDAWRQYAQVLLASNEFAFVD